MAERSKGQEAAAKLVVANLGYSLAQLNISDCEHRKVKLTGRAGIFRTGRCEDCGKTVRR